MFTEPAAAGAVKDNIAVPPTTSASPIDVTPTGIVKVCPVLKVIMHFPETETSIVTAAEVESANPEVQASHFTEA